MFDNELVSELRLATKYQSLKDIFQKYEGKFRDVWSNMFSC